MLIGAVIAGLMIFSLFLSMLTQSPRELEPEEAVVRARPESAHR